MRTDQLLLVSALLCLGTAPLQAQVETGLSLEVGMASLAGHARSVGITPETSGHPSPFNTWGVRFDRTGAKVRFSMGLLIGSTGVEFENDDASAEVKNLLSLLEFSPEISIVILQPRDAALRLHAGAVIDRWSPEGDDSRTSMGGLGAVSVEIPFSSRIGVQVRWEAMMTGSVFDEDDLPLDFERKSGIRQRWALGARYRL